MMNQILRASIIGLRGLETLQAGNFTAEIQGIFDTSFNLVTPQRLLIGVLARLNRGPTSLIVDGLQHWLPKVAEGMRAIRKDSCLLIPAAGLAISFKEAAVWSGQLRLTATPADPAKALIHLQDTCGRMGRYNDEPGLGQLLPNVFDYFQGIKEEQLHTIAQYALPHLRALQGGMQRMLSLSRRRPEFQATALTSLASPLIGLGPGLTPSGDDVLTGLMATMYLVATHWGWQRGVIRAINHSLAAAVEGRTTIVSENQLRYAARGEVAEAVLEVVLAALQARDDLEEKVAALLQVGASSGGDLLLGICLGFRLLAWSTVR
ncbi:MAG: DUF2877 domain-containing protein [Chloroflexi bacterium]|nr:DUF2877 domain-containing protein [Chloroflexota bacterium]MCL5074073.1 DUF2877 domain-containing protein [Chloroflexota bacterium]